MGSSDSAVTTFTKYSYGPYIYGFDRFCRYYIYEINRTTTKPLAQTHFGIRPPESDFEASTPHAASQL